jgi:hypothetical protein
MSYLTLGLLLPARGAGDQAPIGPFQVRDGNDAAVDITGWTNFRLIANVEENPSLSGTPNAFELAGAIVTASDGTYQFLPDAPAIAAPARAVPYWIIVKATPPDGLERTFVKGRLPIVDDFAP